MSSQLSYAFRSSIRTDCDFNPKRYALDQENQEGTLKARKRSFPLRVFEMSACEFNALMEPEHADRVRLGSVMTLCVLEGEWEVEVKRKTSRLDGQIELELVQIEEEETEPVVPRAGFFARSRSVSIGGRDPILPLAVAAVFVITILISPSLGGRWGTAQSITQGAQTIWEVMTSFFKG